MALELLDASSAAGLGTEVLEGLLVPLKQQRQQQPSNTNGITIHPGGDVCLIRNKVETLADHQQPGRFFDVMKLADSGLAMLASAAAIDDDNELEWSKLHHHQLQLMSPQDRLLPTETALIPTPAPASASVPTSEPEQPPVPMPSTTILPLVHPAKRRSPRRPRACQPAFISSPVLAAKRRHAPTRASTATSSPVMAAKRRHAR
jgi:hypothetical protein